jgi:hypothetical protein
VGCEIQTGVYVDELPAVNDCGLKERPVDPSILFNAQSTSEFSPTFNVAEGECALLSAYSTCGGTIQIEKLLFSKPELPFIGAGSCACDFPIPTPEQIAGMDVCGWTMSDCAQIRNICTPGTYRLHAPANLLGCLMVTMERVRQRATPIPQGLVLGA